jgi:hypothetical protein
MFQANPLNVFQWKIILFGLNPLSEIEVQKVKIPEVEIQPIEVGAGPYDEKFSGKIKVGDLECEKLKVGITGQFDPVYQWFQSAMDYTFGAKPPAVYKKSGQLILVGADMITKLKVYEMTGVFPKKLSYSDLDLKGNEVFMEKIIFSVTKFKEITI